MSREWSRLNRRQFLAGSCAAMLLPLSACCEFRARPTPQVGDRQTPPGKRLFSVAPEAIQRSRLKPQFAIDVHSHFFNASDVNVQGYVAESWGHSMPPAAQPFIYVLSQALDSLAEGVTTAAAEYKELSASAGAGADAALSMESMKASFDRRIETHMDASAQNLFKELEKRDGKAKYRAAAEDELGQRIKVLKAVPNAVPTAVPELSPELIRRAMSQNARRPFDKSMTAAPSLRVDGLLAFAGYMLNDRWMNLRSYQQKYSTDDGAFGIDAAFGSLVDFDYWFACPCYSARSDQMKVMALLSYLSGGYMLPLVGYNPWTDLNNHGESYQLVKTAIENFGYVGVKIYPPVGYYPYGNEELNKDGPRLPKDLHALDAALKQMFDYCARMNVPVMAHANRTLGRDATADDFGGRKGWDRLMAKYAAETNAPIIQLGHFGGDSSSDGSNWPSDFAALMQSYRANNRIYGDVAFWDHARDCSDLDSDNCKILLDRLQQAHDIYPDLSKRLMYGSDWLMLSQNDDWPAFPAQIATALSGLSWIDRDNLFYRNAMNCFGLSDKNSDRYKSVVAHLQLSGADLPKWLA